MPHTTVREAMTPSPTTIPHDADVTQAARTMIAEDVGSLPVVDGTALVGMVTDRDLVANVVAKNVDPVKTTVAEVCTESPVIVSPDEPLDTALARMADAQVRRLPVVDEGRVVGILSQADVSRAAEPSETGALVEQISRDPVRD
ncbi:MAG: CBS domain-containing protein [Gaiellaceae bacterium]